MIPLASNWPWRITRCRGKWLWNNSVQCTPDAIRRCWAAVISICWSRTRAWLWWVQCKLPTRLHQRPPFCNPMGAEGHEQWAGWNGGWGSGKCRWKCSSQPGGAISAVIGFLVKLCSANFTITTHVAYIQSPRIEYVRPAGRSCNLFQFVWTAEWLPLLGPSGGWCCRVFNLLHTSFRPAALLNQPPPYTCLCLGQIAKIVLPTWPFSVYYLAILRILSCWNLKNAWATKRFRIWFEMNIKNYLYWRNLKTISIYIYFFGYFLYN